MIWNREKPQYNRIGRKMTTVAKRVAKAKRKRYLGYVNIVVNLTLLVVFLGMVYYYTAQAIMMLFLLFLFAAFMGKV